jgi:hypothetical protein
MIRLTLTLATWLSFVSVGSASLTPAKASRPFGSDIPPVRAESGAPHGLGSGSTDGAESTFLVTDRTDVLLNGKPCKYAEVPGHARIVRMELGPDNKTVLRVFFRTGK